MSSRLIIGGFDEALIDKEAPSAEAIENQISGNSISSTPWIAYFKLLDQSWTIQMKQVYLQDSRNRQSISLNLQGSRKALIDSGTSYILIPEQDFRRLITLLEQEFGK